MPMFRLRPVPARKADRRRHTTMPPQRGVQAPSQETCPGPMQQAPRLPALQQHLRLHRPPHRPVRKDDLLLRTGHGPPDGPVRPHPRAIGFETPPHFLAHPIRTGTPDDGERLRSRSGRGAVRVERPGADAAEAATGFLGPGEEGVEGWELGSSCGDVGIGRGACAVAVGIV